MHRQGPKRPGRDPGNSEMRTRETPTRRIRRQPRETPFRHRTNHRTKKNRIVKNAVFHSNSRCRETTSIRLACLSPANRKKFGRGGGIRTRDPLHPMQVRYQAAPRPDSEPNCIRRGRCLAHMATKNSHCCAMSNAHSSRPSMSCNSVRSAAKSISLSAAPAALEPR
jgi:hypothetical protein